jgi:predicted NodU family carbamoyl transferase
LCLAFTLQYTAGSKGRFDVYSEDDRLRAQASSDVAASTRDKAMSIVGYKSAGHDGALCSVDDGVLTYSIEGEKDSRDRRDLLPATDVEAILDRWGTEPEVVCGDCRELGDETPSHYKGASFDDILWSKGSLGRRSFEYAAVPHELSHLTGTYALSDLPENQEFYALLWEGYLGRFYHVDSRFRVEMVEGIDHPGARYSFPYHGTGRDDKYGHSAAGKIMALAGLARPELVRSERVQRLTRLFLDAQLGDKVPGLIALDGDIDRLYAELAHLKDEPVDSPEFVALCKSLQDAIFERYYELARRFVTKKLPLLISGGCGLNCDWNSQWRDCGLFSSVFVAPVPNDSGIAIGAAAAINYVRTGKMKLRWSVYGGEEFVHEDGHLEGGGFVERPLDLDRLCEGMINQDWVVAWIQGRYEIGPRALCHRSLMAAPFSTKTRDRLNEIKQREYFRPVAPVCMEECVSDYFDWQGPSPYMLYFQHVRSRELGAVTHLDGTARVQTINASEDARTHALLQIFKKKTGFGVACNTSLNFPGKGFINRTSDIAKYAKAQGLQCVVIDDRMYLNSALT